MVVSQFVYIAFQKEQVVYDWFVYKLSCWSVSSVKTLGGLSEAKWWSGLEKYVTGCRNTRLVDGFVQRV